METPDAFKALTRNFIQDIDLIGKTPEEIIDFAVQSLSKQEREIVKVFLDDVLGGQYDPRRLNDMWWASQADIVFANPDHSVEFLKLIRKRL